MSHRAQIVWTFAITSIALFMTTLDNLVVTTALPTMQRDLHASISGLEWTVNAYTLTFAVLLMLGAAVGPRGGRPPGAQARVPRRPRHLPAGVGGGRHVAVDRVADRRPRAPGRRWRHRHPADPDHPGRRRPGREARARAGPVGRRVRPWCRARAARRRRGRPGALVAVD